MKKKQVNLRLNPAIIEKLEELQHLMFMNGFSVSKADVVEDAIHEMHKRAFPPLADRNELERTNDQEEL